MRRTGRHFFPLITLFLLLIPTISVLASEDEMVRDFEWKFKESPASSIQWSWSLNISVERLDAYKDFSVNKRRNYGQMITTKDENLIEASMEFNNASIKKGYDRNTEVSFVLSFVQSLEYTSDKVTTGYDEYPRFPLETLADKGGDCEDTSILFATLIILLEYDAVLFLIPGTTDDPGHMAVGVAGEGLAGSHITHDEKKYYYAETTGADWKIGEIPREHKNAVIQVVEFTGEQYDPLEEEENKHPLRVLVESPLFIVIISLVGIFFYLLFSIVRSYMRSRKNTGALHPKDDPYGLFSSGGAHKNRDGGSVFFRTKEDRKRSKGFQDGARPPRCRLCSGSLRYFHEYDDWLCERCDSFPAGHWRDYYQGDRTKHRYRDALSRDFVEFDIDRGSHRPHRYSGNEFSQDEDAEGGNWDDDEDYEGEDGNWNDYEDYEIEDGNWDNEPDPTHFGYDDEY